MGPEAPPARPQWRVTGGTGQGGIIVRKGRDRASTQLPERLAAGSIVEEQELVGDRLRFRRLSGSGPAAGWVSLTHKERSLLVPLDVALAAPARAPHTAAVPACPNGHAMTALEASVGSTIVCDGCNRPPLPGQAMFCCRSC